MKRDQNPILEALTEEARRAIEGPRLYLNVIPFRCGREERKKDRKGWLKKPRFLKGKPNNDFYMLDNRNYREISREHFLIQYNGEGFVLKDRGSHCGTLVNSALYAQTCRIGHVPPAKRGYHRRRFNRVTLQVQVPPAGIVRSRAFLRLIGRRSLSHQEAFPHARTNARDVVVAEPREPAHARRRAAVHGPVANRQLQQTHVPILFES